MVCNMLQKLKGTPVIRLHTWAFYLLCGFGLFSSVSTTVTSIFLSLLTALLLFRLWVKHDDWQDALPDGQLCLALLLLMVAVVLSSFFSSDILHSLRVFSHQYGTRAVGLFAVLLMIRQRKQLIWIAACIGISLFINDVAVVFQGVVQGDYRAVGFSSYMTVGGILSMLLPALLLLSLGDHLDVRWRTLAAGSFLLGCGALLYNGTRGAWLAVPVAMCLCTVVFVRQKRRFVIGALVALSVFAGIFMMSPSLSSRFVSIGDTHNQSNSERFLLWTSAYHMFVDHPLFGVGFAEFQTSYHREYVSPEAKEPWLAHAHSNVMHMLAECGGVGLLALLFFWYTFLSYGFRTWMATRHIAALLIPAILLGLILQGLTEYNMGNAAVMKLYWVLMGLCLQWLRLDHYAPA